MVPLVADKLDNRNLPDVTDEKIHLLWGEYVDWFQLMIVLFILGLFRPTGFLETCVRILDIIILCCLI
jgi:hypothetical protein